MRASTKVLAVAAMGALVLVFPFRVTVAPDWDVSVVDEHGQPLPGALVSEFSSHGAVGFVSEQTACTDSNGEAHFPRLTLRVSALARALGQISHPSLHHGNGAVAKVGAERLGYGDMPDETPSEVWNNWSGHVKSKFVLHQCPKGFTGYGCHFNDDDFLSISGDTAQKIADCQNAAGRGAVK